MATALITGASSGIGMELARAHATAGGDLVLVARNKSKLEELKLEFETSYNVKVLVVEKDLSLPNAALEVYNEIISQNISIDYLINNAGFGDFGFFAESDWSKNEQMIHLNITALTQFTHLFLQDMLKRGSGKIMNVASVAAFLPGPLMAVYFATKAYVLSFSEAVDNEVRDRGISVTVLCPGATESAFKVAAAAEDSRLFKGRKLASSKEVAIFGYGAMLQGKSVAIHGMMNFMMANSVRFTPRKLVSKVARMMQGKV